MNHGNTRENIRTIRIPFGAEGGKHPREKQGRKEVEKKNVTK